MSVKKAGEMTFLEHLEELRWRIIKILIALTVASIAAYFFSDYLFIWIKWPLDQASPDKKITLNYLKISDAFNFRVKLAILAGIFISIPITLYQIWKFIMPGLHSHEKKMVFGLVFWSSLLFLSGATMCYLWLLPITIEFLLNIAPEGVAPVLTLNDYLSFVMGMTLSFGFVFQLPLVSLLLGKLGLINARFLAKGRRYAILIISIVAAVVTPSTDAFTMMMMAGPLYLLYEVSIILLKLNERARKKKILAG